MKDEIIIPSVKSEDCTATLKFQKKEYEIVPWNVEFDCSTPTFTASLTGQIETDVLKQFKDDLNSIEKERRGECQLYDEWNFSLTIKSIDSVGHFIVIIGIWAQGAGHDGHSGDTLDIAYEIEPSILIDLVEKFNDL